MIAQHFAQYNECPNTTLEFYKVGKLIGKGAFGKVISATQKLTGLPVAMKAIEKAYIADEHHRKKVFQEVFILNKIRHRRIIKILEVFESMNHLLITMEFAGGGDLLQFVKGKKRLTEEEARPIFQQVIEGAMAIHGSGVLHRDFKLDNILLDSTGKQVKICDFGVSRVMRKGQRVAEQCGTPAYIAPEIIADRGYEGFYSDTWSLGVCLYAMLCGTVPFKATNIKDLHKLILTARYDLPEELSLPVKDLISRMISLVPSQRITLEDVLEHEWVKTVRLSDNSRETDNFSIDNGALEAVVGMGFPQDQVVAALRLNEMNHATATYYLLHLQSR